MLNEEVVAMGCEPSDRVSFPLVHYKLYLIGENLSLCSVGPSFLLLNVLRDLDDIYPNVTGLFLRFLPKSFHSFAR